MMKIFPIRVPRKLYRGGNATLKERNAQYNRDVSRLEKYLNESIELDPNPIQVFMYADVAVELGLSLERVREIVGFVDGGYNGLTVAKSEEAWCQFHGTSS